MARPTSHTDQVGNVVTYGYDASSRKTSEGVTGVSTTTFTYHPAGDLRQLVDGKSQTTTWTYDAEGRVTKKAVPGGTEVLRYTYDANARLATRWSAAKGTTKYGYDTVGNLLTVNYPTGQDLTFQYNPLNRVTRMIDASGTTDYGWFAGGRLQSENGPFANDTVSYKSNSYVRYAYDAAGQLTWAKATNSSAWEKSGSAGSCRPPHSCQSLLRAGCPRTRYHAKERCVTRRASDGAWRSAAGSAPAWA